MFHFATALPALLTNKVESIKARSYTFEIYKHNHFKKAGTEYQSR